MNSPEIYLFSHQDKILLSSDLLSKMTSAACKAVSFAFNMALDDDAPLCHVDEVEVSFVKDHTIADVHLQFMNILGATDVITFDHGEILISVETAQKQALQFGNTLERELMLYLIHGLLHLAGYDDSTESDRLRMDQRQHEILDKVWK